MRSPRLLDVFCGGGGCSMGYARAGFADIVGVDIVEQPRYPFEFVRNDAMYVLRDRAFLRTFDLIHASPPCQGYSTTASLAGHTVDQQKLLPDVEQALKDSGVDWVIENVPGAPLTDAVVLCGNMFGLKVYRHRLFKTSFSCRQPKHIPHVYRTAKLGCSPVGEEFMSVVGHVSPKAARKAMGIDWMIGKEISEAIPPAYTEFVGQEWFRTLGSVE